MVGSLGSHDSRDTVALLEVDSPALVEDSLASGALRSPADDTLA